MSHQTRESPVLRWVIGEASSPARSYFQPGHTAGYKPDRVIPGVEAHGRGSVVLEVTFGSPGNSRSEELLFTIAPFQRGYHALLGRTAFAHFNALPHYGYLTLKMPGPRGVITVSGIIKCPSCTEEYATALAAGL